MSENKICARACVSLPVPPSLSLSIFLSFLFDCWRGGTTFTTTTTTTTTTITTIIIIFFFSVLRSFPPIGQSNMALSVNVVYNASEIIANANQSYVRLFRVPRTDAASPQADLAGGLWTPANRTTVPQFSAVCYLTALEIDRLRTAQLGYRGTYGLIESAIGSTCIESWMSATALHYAHTQCGAQPHATGGIANTSGRTEKKELRRRKNEEEERMKLEKRN